MRQMLCASAAIAAALAAMPAAAQTDPHAGHAMPGMEMPDMPDHDMANMAMPGMDMADLMHDGASGTSRLPVAGPPMAGLHIMSDDWMIMAHGYGWGVYTDQGGPRGSDKAFVESIAMLMAARPVGDGGKLQLRAMLSAEPLMGDRGYPNLFSTGETAGGRALIDRQHPHDLFMELSARLDMPVGDGMNGFLYVAPVGEPALGPTAFMHRPSARLNPDAPITHHWFDSTHIAFGVVTAGLAGRHWQAEGSVFTGREPDEDREDIERPRFDSWSLRATWLPDDHWSASLSYARIESPEVLHPGEDEGRLVASIAYASKGFTAAAGWSRKKRIPGRALQAGFAEANWAVTPRHNLFGRVELVDNDELFPEGDPLHDRPFTVGKATLGYAYELPLGRSAALALGGAASAYAKPDRLDAAYGRNPMSLSLFAKLTLGQPAGLR